MNAFKEQCIALRKKDYSLAQITEVTGRPKTSVFFHIRDIPLSKKKQQLIRQGYAEHIRKFALERKGKSLRSFRKFQDWNPETVLLVSHLLFDGEITSSSCVYHNRSRALLERVERLMKNIYEFEPARHANKKTGVLRISYFNVALSAFFREKANELKKTITTQPLNCKREFLRAFFDDEGCIDFQLVQRKKRIRGYQKDVAVLKIVQRLLLSFGISSYLSVPNEVVISGKENLLKFQKEVNFSPGVRVNGKRANSRWKKNLEKRKLLELAIHSFRT
ncbi:MAG: LAGLIDADG family homing endonuclease [Candidatus Paceibacterota bacterium]